MTGEEDSSRHSFWITVKGYRLAAEVIKPVGFSPDKRLPTLLFLHEGLGSIGQWKDFPLALSKASHLQALIYERRGHGKSDPPRGKREVNYLHEEALEYLPQVMKEMGIKKAILVGHSDGGSIALIYAAAHPGNVLGVITEAAHVFVEDITIRGIRKAVRVYETSDLRERLARYHGNNTDRVFRGWADTWWHRSSATGISSNTCQKSQYLSSLSKDSTMNTDPAQVETIVEKVSGRAEGKVIFNCGHTPHDQARERVLSEMSRFIASLVKIKIR
jgi:pimeloyl-ACP methyl ester carboxylesterase